MKRMSYQDIEKMSWVLGESDTAEAVAAVLDIGLSEARALVREAREAYRREHARQQAVRYLKAYLQTEDGQVFLRLLRDAGITAARVSPEGEVTLR